MPYWRQKCRKKIVLDLLLFGPQKLANPEALKKKELALEKCVEQSQIYVKERLGEGAEYIDYVISKVVMKKQFDAWEKKQADGKYLFGAKAECQFSVKILKAPL